MPDSENMMRHHQNGRTLAMEGHTPGGEARRPPIGGRRSPTLHGGWASMHGGQRPISLEYQIYPPAIDTLVTGMPPIPLPKWWLISDLYI